MAPYVVVSLHGLVEDYIEEIPFHTVALEWDVGNPPEGLDQQQSEQCLEEIRQGLEERIRGLMETLRGDEGA